MSLGEFDLIARFFQRKTSSSVILGVGDDAAVVALNPGEELYVTTDCLVENVHFTSCWSARDLGYKALAVNLSDLAAHGARPKWFTLSLCLPCVDENWLRDFSQGLLSFADQVGVELIGGNTSRGALSISITLLGVSEPPVKLLRANARVGDVIYVTGKFGAARLGVDVLEQRLSIAAVDQQSCLDALFHPVPQLEAGLYLRDVAHAAIDISDGLAADLGHVLTASSVGASVSASQIPIADCVRHSLDDEAALAMALSGGEDYQLLFTCSLDRCDEIEKHFAKKHWDLSRIGVIDAQPGLRINRDDGSEVTLSCLGFRHY